MNIFKYSLCYHLPKYIKFASKNRFSFLYKKNFHKSTIGSGLNQKLHQNLNHPKNSKLNVMIKNNQMKALDKKNEDELELLQEISKLIFKENYNKEDIDFDGLRIKLNELIDICERNSVDIDYKRPKIRKEEKLQNDKLRQEEREKVQTRKELKKERRGFKFENYKTRYIAMQLLYIGWQYQGYANLDVENTIEDILMKALKKTQLIPEDCSTNKEIRYARCGRTDKGVSALSQVISLDVRSKQKKGEIEAMAIEKEYDYAMMLNGVLPDDIRVWGWTPVPNEFSARFSTVYREYKYYVIDEKPGNLDLDLMNQGAQKLVGIHDFRNFCKMNLEQTEKHVREVERVSLVPIIRGNEYRDMKIFEFSIKSRAFLWHQVRCIMAVLLLIGQKVEVPGVIDDLLDIDKMDSKPIYQIASEYPLVLWDCSYENLKFRRPVNQIEKTIEKLEEKRNKHILGTLMLDQMMNRIEEINSIEDQTIKVESNKSHGKKKQKSVYVNLLNRGREPSMIERQKNKKTE